MRDEHVPPESMEGYSDKEISQWKTEFDVVSTLRHSGHEVIPLGVYDDLAPIRNHLREFKPHVVFMLLEEFHGVVTYDHAVISYLELMRQPYTGCNARGLLLSKDKALSKKILAYHRIPTPKFAVCAVGRKFRRPPRLEFPLLVKSTVDDASLGISQASVVHNDAALEDRIRFIHESNHSEALIEQFIPGRELYVGVIGNRRLQTFRPWELFFDNMPAGTEVIATAKVKWDHEYQKKLGVMTRAAKELTPALENKIKHVCKRVYRALSLSGYARMDLRLTADGQPYVLEANPNPNIAYGEDFAESAHYTGFDYVTLLHRIISLGLSYQASWRAT